MPDVQVVTGIDYYSIDNNLLFEKHSSFTEAKNSPNLKFILKHVIGYNPMETNNYGTIKNYASSLHLLNDSELEYDTVTENDWKLKIRGFGLTHGYAYHIMWINFVDSFGFSQEENFGISVQSWIEAYKRFQLLNTYKGYKLATVSVDNATLKAEIQILKQELDKLSDENKQLKSHLSQMA